MRAGFMGGTKPFTSGNTSKDLWIQLEARRCCGRRNRASPEEPGNQRFSWFVTDARNVNGCDVGRGKRPPPVFRFWQPNRISGKQPVRKHAEEVANMITTKQMNLKTPGRRRRRVQRHFQGAPNARQSHRWQSKSGEFSQDSIRTTAARYPYYAERKRAEKGHTSESR